MIYSLSILLLFSSSILGSSAEDCDEYHFKCGTGECIHISIRCNGRPFCADGSDEENCKDYVCHDTQFKCTSTYECVNSRARCNIDYDCKDGSDEVDCEEHECKEGLHVCSSGQCLNPEYRCDGQADCSDGSDEEDCQDFDCPDTSHPCTTGHCLLEYRKCDGREGCTDKSDEENCPESSDLKYLAPGFGWDRSTVEDLGWMPMGPGENCCVACQASNAYPETTHFIVYKFYFGVYCRCLEEAEDKEATSVSMYKIFGQQNTYNNAYNNQTIAKLIDLPFTQDGFCVED